MKYIASTFLISAVLMSSTASFAQTTANPLDRFRTDNPQNQTQQVNTLNAVPPSNSGGLPAPTMGGMQQQGLTQEQINQALQDYNLGDDPTFEERQAEVERQARRQAFEAALNGALPLTADEILELLDRYRDVREASESRIGGAPDAEVVLKTVSLDPGASPHVIKLSPGHVTTLNIVDITGQPWPIQDISWGGNFEVIQPQEGEHVVRISPMKAHEVGNISVQLLELNTPIVFSLRTFLEDVHYRFDAQIPEMGPYSDTPIIDNFDITTKAGSEDIVDILNGTPSGDVIKLDVTGVDARTTAYDYNGQTFVRTPHTLLSPGWSSSVTSADGMTVYAIGQSPVLLLSDRGKMVRARIDYN
jgi:intracellular multiplication protein IcmK